MKENKYDDKHFFEQYSQMPRSKEGLKAAGEWHELKKMLPDFNQKTVLDLGVALDGTVSMQLNMVQKKYLVSIYPKECLLRLNEKLHRQWFVTSKKP